MKILQRGNIARTVEPTSANETSSRSHALLSVSVKQTTRPASSKDIRHRARVKHGRLFMIDLAGSERLKQTKVSLKKKISNCYCNMVIINIYRNNIILM